PQSICIDKIRNSIMQYKKSILYGDKLMFKVEGNSPVANLMVQLQKLAATNTHENMKQALERSNLIFVKEPKKTKDVTFEDAVSWYLQSSEFERKSKATQKTYRSELNQFVSFI